MACATRSRRSGAHVAATIPGMGRVQWKAWAVIACLVGLLLVLLLAPPDIRPFALLGTGMIAAGIAWWARAT